MDMHVWQQFLTGLRYKNRFSLQENSEKFVVQLLAYAKKHKTKRFIKGRKFYRARINELHHSGAIAINKMGAPPKEVAGHGRLNPKGIPYLYLSSNQLTAISEVRPWVGGHVTVAEFELIDNVKLINFSSKFFQNKTKSKENEGSEFTWRELITWMFSAPFDPRDDTAYVPTQYLSERIKGNGYDGIIYDSSLNPNGYNVTLFDISSAEPLSRQLAKIQSIKLKPTYKAVDEENANHTFQRTSR